MMRSNGWNFVLAIFGLVAMSLGCRDIPHKTDAQMIDHFRENRDGFEFLLRMIQEDQEKIGEQLFRIDVDWTQPKDLDAYGIDRRRVDEYRRLFKQIGVPRGFYAYDKATYLFMASATGLGVSGSSKGYVWSAKRPQTVVEGDLDEFQRSHHQYRVCRPLEGNWYLESSH